MRICTKCQKKLSDEYFVFNNAHCKECRKTAQQHWRTTLKGKYRCLLYQAEKRKIDFSISFEEFSLLFDNQVCHYCGITQENLALHPQLSMGRNNLSVDRIDNNKGYVSNNVVLCCYRCNFTKSNLFSEQEMREIAEKFIKPKWDSQ